MSSSFHESIVPFLVKVSQKNLRGDLLNFTLKMILISKVIVRQFFSNSIKKLQTLLRENFFFWYIFHVNRSTYLAAYCPFRPWFWKRDRMIQKRCFQQLFRYLTQDVSEILQSLKFLLQYAIWGLRKKENEFEIPDNFLRNPSKFDYKF